MASFLRLAWSQNFSQIHDHFIRALLYHELKTINFYELRTTNYELTLLHAALVISRVSVTAISFRLISRAREASA